ncbi:MAG TPA: hypothetical protein ENJ37_02170 [Deltaproteobacteria bacterium]|nr:hypothetical protein [Deltaproteobacteria bacterium]
MSLNLLARPIGRTVAAVFVLAALCGIETAASGAPVTVAVLPWRLNAEESGFEYARAAVEDLVLSRIGSAGAVRMRRKDLVARAAEGLGDGPIDDAAARRLGEKLACDYVVFGSLTIMGDYLSLDVRLLSVGDGSVRFFYANGASEAALIEMASEVAEEVIAAVSPEEKDLGPPAMTYRGKFAPSTAGDGEESRP